MGCDDAGFSESEDDMIRTLLASDHPFIKGITLERLDRERSVRLNVAPAGEPFLPFAKGQFGTPSGKCEFDAETLDYAPPVESRLGAQDLRARYPLEMVSAKSDDSMNSTFGNQAAAKAQTSTLFLHTDDASARSISTGDRVRVFNGRGSCLLMAVANAAHHQALRSAPPFTYTHI